ncbi:MAG: phosphatase PAP2 family protein [bacterium]|nr:phosphatase PAP2 family protein [bacterium]
MSNSPFLFLNNLSGQSVFFDTIVVFCAQYLLPLLVVGIIVFLLIKREKIFEKFFIILGSASVAWIISQAINWLFPIARPFLVLDIQPLFFHGGYDSFPSGHATFAFVLAVMLFYYNKPLAWAYTLGALLIGISRIIAGVHWPIDILGGYALGSVVVIIMHYFWYKGRV